MDKIKGVLLQSFVVSLMDIELDLSLLTLNPETDHYPKFPMAIVAGKLTFSPKYSLFSLKTNGIVSYVSRLRFELNFQEYVTIPTMD